MPSSKTVIEETEEEDYVVTPSGRYKRSRLSATKAIKPLNFAGHSPKKQSELQHVPNATTHQSIPVPFHQEPNPPTNTMSSELAEEKLNKLQNLMTEFILAQKTSNDEVKRAINSVQTDTSEIKDIKSGMNTMFERFDNLEKQFEGMKEDHKELESKNSENSMKIRDLEDAQLQAMDRLNPNHLILNGIYEKADERPEEVAPAVNRIIRVNLGLQAPCTTAYRVGKIGGNNRPIRIYWVNQEHRNQVLNNSKHLPEKVYLNKDVPLQLREINKKLRKKAGELYRKNVPYEYRLNGIVVNGALLHHSEIVFGDTDANIQAMDSQ